MKALVRAPICALHLHPDPHSERVDELFCGAVVDLLEQDCPKWPLVKTQYGYTGYAPAEALWSGNTELWEVLPKRMVLGAVCDVLSAPAVQAYPVETLVRGALVSPKGFPDEKDWQQICLCNGQIGYTKRSFLAEYNQTPPLLDEAAQREAITASALTYLGVPYRWGGKSPLGIDCSGLTFMAYALNGVTIYRDARIEKGFPVHKIPPHQMKRADLLFFPGHVALFLGDSRYVHATAKDGSDGVVINSLNPSDPDYRADLAQTLTAVGSIF